MLYLADLAGVAGAGFKKVRSGFNNGFHKALFILNPGCTVLAEGIRALGV